MTVFVINQPEFKENDLYLEDKKTVLTIFCSHFYSAINYKN